MLKTIRNLNFGWIIILIGFITILSGISMTEGTAGEQTFLCFDEGCIYFQGVSNIVVGFFSIGLGLYLIFKNEFGKRK